MSDSEDTDYSESESFNTVKSLTSLQRVASSKLGVTTATLSYHDVRRLVEIDDEEVTPKEDSEDDLSEAMVAAAESLAYTERSGSNEVSVEPLQSLALLFDTGEAKGLKARLMLAMNSRDSLDISAILVCCDFAREDGLGTSRFTTAYCDRHRLPRLNSSTLLIDVVASAAKPGGAGALLVLSAYNMAQRSRKYERVASLAVTERGRKLFRDLGFEEHAFREGGSQSLFWIDTGDLRAQEVSERLRLDGEVKGRCFRAGASPRTADKRYARCS